MSNVLTPSRVLGTAEARKRLPSILEEFREHGDTAEPVFIGSYRRVDAVVISASLAARLAPLLEDLLLADRLRDRLTDPGEAVGGDEVVASLGLTAAVLDDARAELLAEFGDSATAR